MKNSVHLGTAQDSAGRHHLTHFGELYLLLMRLDWFAWNITHTKENSRRKQSSNIGIVAPEFQACVLEPGFLGS